MIYIKNKKAFTLVELIVVVTILAILSTIGFVSYSSYLTGVRDTNRLAQLVSIHDGLELYRTKNDLPLPDDNVGVVIGTETIAYQGYAGVNTLESIDFTKGGKDPKDNEYFTYYLTEDRKYFQLMAFLEEESDTTSQVISSSKKIEGDIAFDILLDSAQAADYSTRIPTVFGKKLGVLTDLSNTPIQEISTITSNSSLILTATTSGYRAYLTDDTILSDNELLTLNPQGSCKRIRQLSGTSPTGNYKINPTGSNEFEVYCDMELDGGGWTLVGVSNGNYPSATFLDGVTGTTPRNLKPGFEYSIDASEISFSEVSMGLDGDKEKYFGFFVPEAFVNARAFESTAGSPQTCVLHENYYSKDGGIKKYWRYHYTFQESLITSRRYAEGGIDLGATEGSCDSSSDSIAVYRNLTSHQIGAGNGAGAGTTWSNMPSTTRTPTTASLTAADYPALGIDRDVWIMVR